MKEVLCLIILTILLSLSIVIIDKNSEIDRLRVQLSLYQKFYTSGYEIVCIDGVPVKRPKAMKGKD